MRLVVFRLVLMMVSLALAVAIGEGFVRLLVPQPISWLAIYQSHPTLPFFSMLPNQSLHVDTGETEWTVHTDGRGFRVPETLLPEASCTALWLGDSFAFGHGVEYEESFIGQIAVRTPGVEQVNAAVSGYGPIQYRKTLEYLGASGMKFDWVFVVSFVGNDFHDTQWDKNPDVVNGIIGNKARLKSLLKRNSHIYRLLSAAYHRFSGGDQDNFRAVAEQLARPAAWQEAFLEMAEKRYASEMRGIQEYATRHGKRVAFLIMPTREAAAELRSREQVGGASPIAATPPPSLGDEQNSMIPVERAQAIFKEIGARYTDLTSVVIAAPAEETFFRFDGHLTPEANRRVAAEILRRYDLRCEMPGLVSPPTGREP